MHSLQPITKLVAQSISTAGSSIIAEVFSPAEIQHIVQILERMDASRVESRSAPAYAIRNLLEVVPEVRSLAESAKIMPIIQTILGPAAFPVRGILFDKVPQANWMGPWHQDLTIAVRQKRSVRGFGRWSAKEEMQHVQPPVAVLEEMLAVRIHLDDCGPLNAPLRVIPGTHRLGRLTSEQIREVTNQPRATCPVPAGGVLLMRPLLLHASSAAKSPGHRRVLHIEYASGPLPGRLEWATQY